MWNSATRKKLLNEDRTFQHALIVAIAYEVTGKETLELQNDAKPGDELVRLICKSRIPGNFSNSRNPLKQRNKKSTLLTFQKSSYACFSCRSPEHSPAQCRLRNVVCSRCKRTGHSPCVCKNAGTKKAIMLNRKDEVFLEEKLFTVFDVNSLFTSEISELLQIENV